MSKISDEKRKMKILTIGHSTRSLDEFLSLLRKFGITTLIDIRRFPCSGRFPHFNRESLEKSLKEAGIRYIWLEDLGGRRTGQPKVKSLNSGLKSRSFRNYADYMQTDQFQNAVEHLIDVASSSPAALMCAEKLFWKCHRRLLSDYLVAHGAVVEHIMDSGQLQSHEISIGAVVAADLMVFYPEEPQERMLF